VVGRGAVGALAVLLNALALNIGFDISVKLWSGFLLGLAGVVAGPGLRTVYHALLRERWQPPARPRRPPGWHGRGLGAGRGLLLGLLLLETAGPFVQSGRYNDDTAPRPPLHGAYALRRAGSVDTAGATLHRLFVHRRGYLITQGADGHFQDYPCATRPATCCCAAPTAAPLCSTTAPTAPGCTCTAASGRIRGSGWPGPCRGGSCRCCGAGGGRQPASSY